MRTGGRCIIRGCRASSADKMCLGDACAGAGVRYLASMAENKASDRGKVRKRARRYVVTVEDTRGRKAQSKGAHSTLRFGLVRAKTGKADPQVKSANVALGQESLKRAKGAFTRKGITLRHGKAVPVFRADPQEPSVLIRRLDDREERGRFIGKEFVPFG